MWLCTDWSIDWNAISSLATLAATFVALFFGLRDVFIRFVNRRSRRIYTAVAVLHLVQLTINRCNALNELLSQDVSKYRSTLDELGTAIVMQGLTTLSKNTIDMELFGDSVATKYVYAVSLIEEINEAGQWLRTAKIYNEASWTAIKEAIGYVKECANQSSKALGEVEPIIKKFVPSEIMELRFGPPPV